MSETYIFIAIAGCIGLLLGGLTIFILLKINGNHLHKTIQDREIELAKLGERILALSAELQQFKDERGQHLSAIDLYRNQLDQSRDDYARSEASLNHYQVTNQALLTQKHQLEAEKSDLYTKYLAIFSENSTLKSNYEKERQHHAEKLALLQEAKTALSEQFKNLAHDIFEDKSKKFAAINETGLEGIIKPLREKIDEFRKKVEDVHSLDIKNQAELRTELIHLQALNQKITKEAHGLTEALKGQKKMQGNWGELILSTVLERSGLREGIDFKREVSFDTLDGKRRPDVIVSLPQAKHLVIDSKVSLNAYTDYVNAENDFDRQTALKNHVKAVFERMNELSNKNYFELPNINSPEMVFMFMPIESAFVEAIKADESLFQKAIGQNVLIVTPTTLLTSLKIVRQLWRFEEQNAHTRELAERAGKIYKKLRGFLESMEKLGRQLDSAKDSYQNAMGQLTHGRDNLILQAHRFEQLGVSLPTQERIPESLVNQASLELDFIPSHQSPSDYPSPTPPTE